MSTKLLDLPLDDIDFRGPDTEVRTYQSATHRCWAYVGPLGAVSITAERNNGHTPAGAVTSDDNAWLFTTRATTVHRPRQSGRHCPIIGGSCEHSYGGQIDYSLARHWDTTGQFDGMVGDDLDGLYKVAFLGGAR